MSRILVTGSRNWNDPNYIYDTLDVYVDPETDVVIHGHCPTGADHLADEWCKRNGVAVERYPADWGKYGKSAGPRRNKLMVQKGADLCLAFPIGFSRGTLNCMEEVEAAGIPVLDFGRTDG